MEPIKHHGQEIHHTPPPVVPDDEPLSIELPEVISISEGDDSHASEHRLKAFGARGLGAEKKSEFKRSLNGNGTGATRCRIFHSRIAAAPLTYMEKQINDWLDNEPIEVKHVGHVIGLMEGKTPEPNMIVAVWY